MKRKKRKSNRNAVRKKRKSDENEMRGNSKKRKKSTK